MSNITKSQDNYIIIKKACNETTISIPLLLSEKNKVDLNNGETIRILEYINGVDTAVWFTFKYIQKTSVMRSLNINVEIHTDIKEWKLIDLSFEIVDLGKYTNIFQYPTNKLNPKDLEFEIYQYAKIDLDVQSSDEFKNCTADEIADKYINWELGISNKITCVVTYIDYIQPEVFSPELYRFASCNKPHTLLLKNGKPKDVYGFLLAKESEYFETKIRNCPVNLVIDAKSILTKDMNAFIDYTYYGILPNPENINILRVMKMCTRYKFIKMYNKLKNLLIIYLYDQSIVIINEYISEAIDLNLQEILGELRLIKKMKSRNPPNSTCHTHTKVYSSFTSKIKYN